LVAAGFFVQSNDFIFIFIFLMAAGFFIQSNDFIFIGFILVLCKIIQKISN
jgi:protein-S-isoprenylcysteine O-methyltransferase Ste14